jgi:two-component system sensor histidine kinase RegB
MASQPTQGSSDPKAPQRLDTAALDAAQAALIWDQAATRRSRLRIRTLVASRWMVIAGEVGILGVARLALDVEAPYLLCFALVGLAAWVNLLTGVASPGQRMAGDLEATAQLGFDVLQIGGLVYLTGGASNPFIVMLIAPVVLAAATLPLRSLAVLGGLAIASVAALAFLAWPEPWGPAQHGMTLGYQFSAAAATVAGPRKPVPPRMRILILRGAAARG